MEMNGGNHRHIMEYDNELNLNLEEQLAASVVAGLAGGGKRDRGDADAAGGGHKKTRMVDEQDAAAVAEELFGDDYEPNPVFFPQQQQHVVQMQAEIQDEQQPPADHHPGEELKPFPFFRYKDYSTVKDPDSLTPLTPPGRVPNFPAKMHAILARPDLAEIVCWMPHGRSWKVLKPREFEIRVIPTYFEHAKFSSFIRQANGCVAACRCLPLFFV
jgi:HSF-type DNA-binding